MRSVHSVSLFILMTLLAGCAVAPRKLDPFGRAITADISIEPGAYRSCVLTTQDRPPELIEGTEPTYPIGRIFERMDGSAQVTFTIDQQGKVVDARAISKESVWFENHALIAIGAWRFRPAEKNGVPIAVRCRQDFGFSLY